MADVIKQALPIVWRPFGCWILRHAVRHLHINVKIPVVARTRRLHQMHEVSWPIVWLWSQLLHRQSNHKPPKNLFTCMCGTYLQLKTGDISGKPKGHGCRSWAFVIGAMRNFHNIDNRSLESSGCQNALRHWTLIWTPSNGALIIRTPNQKPPICRNCL